MIEKTITIRRHPTYEDVWVTEDGQVFRELIGAPDGSGYPIINLGNSKSSKLRRHVIVCETYHGLRPPGMVVRHRNGTPGEDHKDNLEWGTQGDNRWDTVRHGTSTKGSKNARAILSEEQVRDIKMRLASGESGKSIADDYGVRQPTISEINTGKTWRHVTLDGAPSPEFPTERVRRNRLDEAKVKNIRQRLEDGDQPASIARDFGVSFTTIWDIKKGKTWKINTKETPC